VSRIIENVRKFAWHRSKCAVQKSRKPVEKDVAYWQRKVARLLKSEPVAIVVMDRGYEDHDWWRKLTADGVFFVSRLKDSTSYGIVEELPLPVDATFLRDEVIVLASDKSKEECHAPATD
jgi:hypothetical protein